VPSLALTLGASRTCDDHAGEADAAWMALVPSACKPDARPSVPGPVAGGCFIGTNRTWCRSGELSRAATGTVPGGMARRWGNDPGSATPLALPSAAEVHAAPDRKPGLPLAVGPTLAARTTMARPAEPAPPAPAASLPGEPAAAPVLPLKGHGCGRKLGEDRRDGSSGAASRCRGIASVGVAPPTPTGVEPPPVVTSMLARAVDA
jgi:hypothetical protein